MGRRDEQAGNLPTEFLAAHGEPLLCSYVSHVI